MLTHQELSRLFSSKRITEISLGDTNFLRKVAQHYATHLSIEFFVKDVFEICYKDLQKNYRSEYFFKNTVVNKILIGKHSLNTATALSEFRVSKSKADCIIINGHSTCYEIKSELDNFDRLEKQLEHYKKIFDRVYVVTEASHIKKLLQMNIIDIGIMELTQKNTLRIVKEAPLAAHEIDARTLIRSLRVGEYTEIIRSIYGEVPDLPNTEIFDACEELLIKAPPFDVRQTFSKVIKKTRKADSSFLRSLPKSLLMAGIEYKLTKVQQQKLLSILNIKLSKDTLCTTLY
ncbi:sce7726 family protein [Pseudomonas sp. H9]|uniref:sce7726 family protein n=1 Tax=Pseudomonas sp. H9 TaxID=483968 RepID=UPI0010579255|nr:sce7726 family protein [Pseudomonas sp. H9]TDF85198.1 hypothetical protein E1573_06030 [Pseudomonas sp. H9]